MAAYLKNVCRGSRNSGAIAAGIIARNPVNIIRGGVVLHKAVAGELQVAARRVIVRSGANPADAMNQHKVYCRR